MILSLSAPTDKAASEMERLGLEVFDANGNLRPLNETFQDLNGKLKEMSKEERINVLNTMFNKVDLKSVNALLANSGERFDELSGYIRESAGAAADMADTMNDNLKGKLTILGSALEGLGIEMYEEFQQPFKEAAETAIESVDSISYSLKNGKLSESMQTVARAIGSIVSKAAELAINALPKLIDGFAFLVDNAKILDTVLASTAGAVVTFKTTMLINDVVKSWQAAEKAARVFGTGMSTSLTGMQAAVGVATRQIGLLEAATAALGSPMGITALAVAGVTAGIVALTIASKNHVSEVDKNKKAIEEFTETLEESQKIRDAIEERRQESINTSFAEIENTERQIETLNELVDANGKVKEGEEGRAQALVEQINSVIPDAISLLEDESGAYVKVADSLDLLIAKKKINALIDANQESYTNALKESREAANKYTEALENQKVAEENLEKAKSDVISKHEIYVTNVNNATEALNEAVEATKEYKNQYEEAVNTMREQDNLLVASKSDSVEEINNAIASQGVVLEQYTANQLEEADKQLQNEKEKLENLKILNKDFNDEYSKSQLEAQEKIVEAAQTIRDNAYAEAEAALVQSVNATIENITSKQGEMLSAGEFLMLGLADGVKNKEQAVLATVASVAANIMDSFTGVKGFIISSPSKWAYGVGDFLMQGLANGIAENSNQTVNATNEMIQDVKDTVQGSRGFDVHSPSKYFYEIGSFLMEGMANGISENTEQVTKIFEELSEDSLALAKEQANDYKELGSLYSENYISGLEKLTDGTIEVIQKNTEAETKAYEKAMDEQLNSRLKKIEEETDIELEKIEDQVSALKKGKSEAEKKAYEERKKELQKRKEQIKEHSNEEKKVIKESVKEEQEAYVSAIKLLGKAGQETLKNALQNIEEETNTRMTAITNEFQSQRDEILSLQESLQSKTSDYGDLFHYDEETGEMVLNDLEKNTQAVNDYYDALDRLSEKGLSDNFVKMIATEYDVAEGTKLLDELLSMSDSRLQSYAEEWDKLQEISSERSSNFLKDELNAIDTNFNQAMDALKTEINSFSVEYLEQAISEFITTAPEKYAEALAIAPDFMEKMLMDMKSKLTDSLGNIGEQTDIVVPIKTEVGDIAEQVAEQTPAVQEAGSELTISLAEQVEDDGDEVVRTVDDIAKDSIQTMERHKGEFEDVGELYIDSLISGMQSKWNVAVSVASEIARSLKEELEEVATFSARKTDETMSTRQLVESAEPSLISRLYDSMVDSINFQQSRVAAASASYITNNNQSSTTTNLGDVNFNIAEVKGNDAGNTINKLMEQAEFYRRQKNLAVGVR